MHLKTINQNVDAAQLILHGDMLDELRIYESAAEPHEPDLEVFASIYYVAALSC